MADTLAILAAAIGAVCATLLFVESLQKPEHQDNWLYASITKAWRYLETSTNPSVVAGVAQIIIDALVSAPEYIIDGASRFYGRFMIKVYGIIGRAFSRTLGMEYAPYLSAFMRDTVAPWVGVAIAGAISFKQLWGISWESALWKGALLSALGFFSGIVSFIIFLFAVVILLLPIALVIAACRRYIRGDQDPVLEQRDPSGPNIADIGVSAISAALNAPVMLVLGLAPALSASIVPAGSSEIAPALAFYSAAVLSYFVAMQVGGRYIYMNTERYDNVDFHLRLQMAAEPIQLPIFYIWTSQIFTFTVIQFAKLSGSSHPLPNILQPIAANVIMDLLAILLTIFMLRRVSENDDDDDDDDGASRKGIFAICIIIIANYIMAALAIFASVFGGAEQISLLDSFMFASGIQPHGSCAFGSIQECRTQNLHFYALYFFLGQTIELPIVVAIGAVVLFWILQPVAFIIRATAGKAWALAQPYPLIARFLAFLGALIVLLRMYGQHEWGW